MLLMLAWRSFLTCMGAHMQRRTWFFVWLLLRRAFYSEVCLTTIFPPYIWTLSKIFLFILSILKHAVFDTSHIFSQISLCSSMCYYLKHSAYELTFTFEWCPIAVLLLFLLLFVTRSSSINSGTLFFYRIFWHSVVSDTNRNESFKNVCRFLSEFSITYFDNNSQSISPCFHVAPRFSIFLLLDILIFMPSTDLVCYAFDWYFGCSSQLAVSQLLLFHKSGLQQRKMYAGF